MNIIDTDAYRTAFAEYLRRGHAVPAVAETEGRDRAPVWQTRRDAKVRPSHRMNDGRVSSWADPPETGHPGEGWICRCHAEPCVEGQTEYAWFDLQSFFWLGGDHEVIHAGDPGYLAVEASGLGKPRGPCEGFDTIRSDAESLLRNWKLIWPGNRLGKHLDAMSGITHVPARPIDVPPCGQ
ncbi:MAG: hypothetical protein LBE86_07640 [Gemmobacter sp.]|jgi:hypothetical protein|nr:hypothetical protein [Gemmobacter sp.]